MANSVLSIYNRALTQALGRGTLTEINAQRDDADILNLYYESVRDTVLRSASWPSCKRHTRLAVLKERDQSEDWTEGDPAPGYRFAYATPSNMLAPRYLHGYSRFELELYEPTNTVAIMTNREDAILHYTARQTDVTRWDVALDQAVMFTLAATICLPLNGKPDVAERLRGQALELVISAQTDIANAADDIWEALPETLEARGFGGPTTRLQYFFPYETFNGVVA